jgi:hypothetical protein
MRFYLRLAFQVPMDVRISAQTDRNLHNLAPIHMKSPFFIGDRVKDLSINGNTNKSLFRCRTSEADTDGMSLSFCHSFLIL